MSRAILPWLVPLLIVLAMITVWPSADGSAAELGDGPLAARATAFARRQAGAISFSRQALVWPGPTSRSGGRPSRQAGIACGQRGWKWQPAGGLQRRTDLALGRAVKRRLRAMPVGARRRARRRV